MLVKFLFNYTIEHYAPKIKISDHILQKSSVLYGITVLFLTDRENLICSLLFEKGGKHEQVPGGQI